MNPLELHNKFGNWQEVFEVLLKKYGKYLTGIRNLKTYEIEICIYNHQHFNQYGWRFRNDYDKGGFYFFSDFDEVFSCNKIITDKYKEILNESC